MEAEVTHMTKDITGEWRDIGALMDQWIQECPYNCACIKGGECEHERYQYGYWPVCRHPRYLEIFAGIPSMCCSEDELEDLVENRNMEE